MKWWNKIEIGHVTANCLKIVAFLTWSTKLIVLTPPSPWTVVSFPLCVAWPWRHLAYCLKAPVGHLRWSFAFFKQRKLPTCVSCRLPVMKDQAPPPTRVLAELKSWPEFVISLPSCLINICWLLSFTFLYLDLCF